MTDGSSVLMSHTADGDLLSPSYKNSEIGTRIRADGSTADSQRVTYRRQECSSPWIKTRKNRVETALRHGKATLGFWHGMIVAGPPCESTPLLKVLVGVSVASSTIAVGWWILFGEEREVCTGGIVACTTGICK